MQIQEPIAILGYGVEGQAMEAYLKRKGHKNLSILDERKDPTAFKNLAEFKTLFRSPGIRLDRAELIQAKEAGAKLTSLTEYFFEACPCPIIGVTGTKGKGTTSTLIATLLKNAGLDAHLGGNIGRPPTDFLDELKPDSIAVLELSSFQLEDLKQSPHIAVLLNVNSDHLDYHPSVEAYHKAKSSILRFQKAEDYLIYNEEYPGPRALSMLSPAQKIPYNKHNAFWVPRADIALRGEHNLENLIPACKVAELLGVEPEIIKETLRAFKGLPHRLEPVWEEKGVQFINDSFSTVPDTSIAAIRSFEEPLYLIAGGSEKFSDFTEWGKACREAKNLKAVLLIGQTAERMGHAIGEKGPQVEYVKNLPAAFAFLKTQLKPGEVVLLSPACASFGEFENYKERGERFRQLSKAFFECSP